MAITVNQLVKDAAVELGAVRYDQTLSATILALGLKKLNQMLADWRVDGIELGYYKQDNGADTVPIAEDAEWPVTVNLAVVMAGALAAPLQQSTIAEATRTKARLEKSTTGTVVIDMTDHPGVGTGPTDIRSDV